jgi:hypothetical protein
VPANPLISNFQTWIKQLIGRSNARPVLTGFLGYDGQVKAVPGDYVPLVGACATASDDGFAGVKPATDNGDIVRVLADKYGRLWATFAPPATSPWSKTATTSATGEQSRSVAVPATWLEAVAWNGSGAAAYLMIFDSAALPADGTVPSVTAVAVGIGDTVSADVGPDGLTFVNGITIALSSTPLTLTAVAATSSYTLIYHVT